MKNLLVSLSIDKHPTNTQLLSLFKTALELIRKFHPRATRSYVILYKDSAEDRYENGAGLEDVLLTNEPTHVCLEDFLHSTLINKKVIPSVKIAYTYYEKGGTNNDEIIGNFSIFICSDIFPNQQIPLAMQEQLLEFLSWAHAKVDASSGFITFDRLIQTDQSPYELLGGISLSTVSGRLNSIVRGYYWANTLSSELYDKLAQPLPNTLQSSETNDVHLITIDKDINKLSLADHMLLKECFAPILLSQNSIRSHLHFFHFVEKVSNKTNLKVKPNTSIQDTIQPVVFKSYTPNTIEVLEFLEKFPKALIAPNRFETDRDFLFFIASLYKAGALNITVETFLQDSEGDFDLENEEHIDAITVELPDEIGKRGAVYDIIKAELLEIGDVSEAELEDIEDDPNEKFTGIWWD